MKKIYTTLFLLGILLIIFVSIYFVNIPSPSKNIVEIYNLDLKW